LGSLAPLCDRQERRQYQADTDHRQKDHQAGPDPVGIRQGTDGQRPDQKSQERDKGKNRNIGGSTASGSRRGVLWSIVIGPA